MMKATLHGTARDPGYALLMVKQQKMAKYTEHCKAEDNKFYALPVETTGKRVQQSTSLAQTTM